MSGLLKKLKVTFIGREKELSDPSIYHRVALIALFAWVGLGADGLSSSCYGPAETFQALGNYKYLSIFLALATMLTVTIISISYSQIISLFPSGGGGYLVASKLLHPTVGMISGCALLIDYVLTITISIASAAEAIFSLLPPSFAVFRLPAELFLVVLLIVMNLRGVKESIVPLVPIFMLFLVTHVFLILYSILTHTNHVSQLGAGIHYDVHAATTTLGTWGMLLLILHAYSMSAGTYTGIEAVSNGLPIIREPRVKNARRTMTYMALSLAFTAGGLILAYLLNDVHPAPGKTLNAVLFENTTAGWGHTGSGIFVLITLLTEGTLLFVAAQAGFLDGPRVLSNMALDRWFPSYFDTLSDRLVTQNGVVLMGVSALLMLLLTGGSVTALLVYYSISVFITFSLSQLGMVKHWWQVRKAKKGWLRKLLINGIGLTLTLFILITVATVKFSEGGWITLVIIGSLVTVAILIKNHYKATLKQLKGVNQKAVSEYAAIQALAEPPERPFNPAGKTAIILVGGYNGLGINTVLKVFAQFGNFFENMVFLEIGVVDAGNFKGEEEMANLKRRVESDLGNFAALAYRKGYHAEGFSAIGTEVITEVTHMAPQIVARFPDSVFFGGQLVFYNESFLTRLLHNNTLDAVQRALHLSGYVIVPIPIKL